MYGLKNYTLEEISKMTYVQKMTISERFEKAQLLLDAWKHELVDDMVGGFLKALFPKSKIAGHLADYPKNTNPWDKCSMTFRQLGIRKEQIVEKLIEWGILPANYYELESGNYLSSRAV